MEIMLKIKNSKVDKMGEEMVILWLVDIFRQSIDTDDVPISMREALISPNFKGGDRGHPASYRPIALTSHISKKWKG